MERMTLFSSQLNVINCGLESFAQSLRAQGVPVQHVDWRPPAGGDPRLLGMLRELDRPAVRSKTEESNREAVRKIIDARPVLIDVKRALEVIPGMRRELILHAGPPVSWEQMSGPVRGAIMGALIYEGLADDLEEAQRLAASDDVSFEPCHHHQAVGPMAGVVSSSMYVYVVKNEEHGNEAYCTLNEGLGKVLRFGAYGEEVIQRLKWMEQILAPALGTAVRGAVERDGGINVKDITARALTMGDECHNRNVAATSLFIRALLPLLLESSVDRETVHQVLGFISANDHSFLNLSMAACKAATDPIAGLEHSSIVSVMARNGTELGIRVAGLGDTWYTAPAGMPKGLYFAGFDEGDSCLDLGDSTVSEVAGIGGFAMAASPAIVRFVGGRAEDAVRYTREMYEICHGEHNAYLIPALDFRGTPVGMDIRLINERSILPIINTGIAHKDPGIGQIGAGILRAPQQCFTRALEDFSRRYGEGGGT
jgi:hypothetical protein